MGQESFTWAPDVHQFGSNYVLYFTGFFGPGGTSSASVPPPVHLARPGRSRPESQPFICQSDLGGSIDPRVFTDSDGTNWMLWKSDQNAHGEPQPHHPVVTAADRRRPRPRRARPTI